MKIQDFFKERETDINQLAKVKLSLDRKTERKLLSLARERRAEFYSVIQMWRGKIIERVFAVRLGKRKTPEYQEVIRRVEGNGIILIRNIYFSTMGGYIVVWEDSHPSSYYFDKYISFNVWYQSKIQYFNVWIQDYLTSMNELARMDPTLKYCAWDKQSIIDWVTIYRKYPEIEMLSKLGMNRLLYNTKILELLKEKKFKKYLFNCGASNNTSGMDVIYGYNHHMNINEVATFKKINKYAKEILKEYPEINKNKLFKYIKSFKTEFKVSSYLDMIKAEKYLNLDLSQDKNSFPHDFEYWHAYYTERYQESINKETDIKITAQANKYKKLIKDIDGLTIVIPTKTSQFINEGNELHHCVGRMGYNEKMAKGESLILFIRKEEDINKSYVTMEYSPKSKKVLQIYGDHDTTPDSSVMDVIYNKWLPAVQKIRFA